jgi:hypothetical protein
MDKHKWKEDALCIDFDTNLFFDKYEDDQNLRPAIENICNDCPVKRQCFAVGVSQKEWGFWGGIYLENGKISRENSKHKTKQDWGTTWQNLTNDGE